MSHLRAVTACACEGRVDAIPSKSDLHRALIAAALCPSPTELSFVGSSEDVEATLGCLSALGAVIDRNASGCTVYPGAVPARATLDARESGSTLRFLIPVAAALGVDATFIGRGRLPARPISTLTELLSAHGTQVSGDGLPLRLHGTPTAGRYVLPGNVSSQYVTALLLALPLLSGESTVELSTDLESAPYVDMTIRTLSAFGVHWEREGRRFRLLPDSQYRSPGVYRAEGDWSNAAFHLVAGAIGGSVTVSGLSPDSLQADRAVLDALRLAGAEVSVQGDAVTVSRPASLKPFAFNVSSCPDLFPILAVLAAAADGESRLCGGGRLRLKESDRIATVGAMLRTLGAELCETEDGMLLRGGKPLVGARVDGAGDHRIVMSAAVASALCDGAVEIVGAHAAAKSYPAFFDDFARLKGASHEI